MATQQHTSIEHELSELSDAIYGLLFLSEGNCTPAQLEEYSTDLTHLLRYARAMGYQAAFTAGKDEEIVIEWLPVAGRPAVICGSCGASFDSIHGYVRHRND